MIIQNIIINNISSNYSFASADIIFNAFLFISFDVFLLIYSFNNYFLFFENNLNQLLE